MAKLFRCWVIVDGTVPTSFRAREQADLLPTLRQLQRTQPGVELKWFERGQLWTSPEAAKAALLERRRSPNARGRDWRPGGQHKDPRAKYDIPRDQKRARFKKRLVASKTRDSGPPATPRPTGSPPHGSKAGGRPFKPQTHASGKDPATPRWKRADSRSGRPPTSSAGGRGVGHRTISSPQRKRRNDK